MSATLKKSFLFIILIILLLGCSKKTTTPEKTTQKTTQKQNLSLHCIEKACFHLPKGWIEQQKEMSWIAPDESTLTFVVEQFDTPLKEYIAKSEKTLISVFKDYKVISREIKKNRSIIEATATVQGEKVAFFFGVIAANNQKYLLTIGGHFNRFYAKRMLLERMIQSFHIQ